MSLFTRSPEIKERRLGRGLEALLGRPVDYSQPAERAESVVAGDAPAAPADCDGLVSVALVDANPYQPRVDLGEAELESLAASIRDHGLLQPIVVRKCGERFQLVAGQRRLRAAQKLGLEKIAAKIVAADDRQVAELALVENLQRKDLDPLEKAASFQQYLQRYQCTQEELASRLKLDRSTIANLIRLLELPSAVQEALRQRKITQGHARALLPLGDEQQQIALTERIQKEGLNVRATEEIVKEMIRAADAEPLAVITDDPPSPRRASDEHLRALEQELRAALGAKVDLRAQRSGRGKIVVHFANHEEFERLRGYLMSAAGRPKAQAG